MSTRNRLMPCVQTREHLGRFRRILGERPGLVRVHVLIGAVGEPHDAADGRGVVARVVELGDRAAQRRELRIQLRIG